LWLKQLFVLAASSTAPSCVISSWRSAKAAISVGQISVKSPG
jgi:hypothetical protein